MNDPADAIARLSSRLSELDERKYASSQAISKLQKQLASVQVDLFRLSIHRHASIHQLVSAKMRALSAGKCNRAGQ